MEPGLWKSEPGHTRSSRYNHRGDRLRQNSRKPASTKRFRKTLANPILCVCWCIRGSDVRLPIGNISRIRGRGPEAARRFPRTRVAAALCTGLMAGVVLLLSINGAPIIWHRLTHRVLTWPLFWMTAILALAALCALWRRRYRLARFCAAGEVTLILWGRAFAQFPCIVVPNLTIYNSSSSPTTIDMLAGALMAGSVLLLPSYKYLLEVFKSNDAFLRHRSLHRSKGSTV